MSSSSADAPFNLASIPFDVVRQIISTSVEHVDIMRLISPRWNGLAVELLSNRKNLPVINSFFVDMSGPHLSLRIPQRFKRYFGVHKWHSTLIPSNSDVLVEYKSVNIAWTSSNKMWNSITRFFSRCSSVERVIFRNSMSRAYAELRTLRYAINGAVVNKFVVRLNADFESVKAAVVDNIGSIKIRTIVFDYSFSFLLSEDLDYFLPEIQKIICLVPKIKVFVNVKERRNLYRAGMQQFIAERRKTRFSNFKEELEKIPDVAATIHESPEDIAIKIVKKEESVCD